MKSVISVLSRKLRSGETTSLALTQRYIEAIEKANPALNCMVRFNGEAALLQAKRADEMIARGEGTALTGIPFAMKDNICTNGVETECCSKILRGFKPYYDAAVWEKLKAQGAVMLGKTNMDEFAMGSTGENSVYGAPSNPYNNGYVTGGSSGGSACAVSANLAAYALGSDTGGSVRQPAAFCGAVGFKPTYGAVSRYGLIAYGSSLDQIGVITKSVSDAATVFDGIKGRDFRDGTSVEFSQMPCNLTGEVKGLKIGVDKRLFTGADKQVAAAVGNAIAQYVKGGAEIVELNLTALEKSLSVYYILACAEASSNLGRYDGIRYGYRAPNYSGVDDMTVKTRTQGFGAEVKKRIMLGTYVLSSGYYDAYYKKARALRSEICSAFEKAFEKCGVIFAPTAPETAFVKGYMGANALKTYYSDMCTVPVNVAGLPAVSIPCGLINGLPAGLQIIGGRGADERVLSVAYYAERENLISVEGVKGGVEL